MANIQNARGSSFFRVANFLLVLVVSTPIFADMRVDRAIVFFEPDAPPRQDVEVSNLSDQTLFLKVEVLEVSNAGTDQEQRRLVTDLESIGFIASPANSVIPPKGRRNIRLLNLREPGDDERIYRVTFKPVLPELTAQTNAIKLLVAYQSLIIIRPKNVDIDVASETNTDGLRLSNNGNANVFLQNGRACHTASKECVDLPSKRLYAGNSWTVNSGASEGKLNSEEYEISYVLNSGKNQISKTF
ncbi:MAG: fimbria/pilus periplasmic chaperone [Pseudomonadales bacterium]